MAYLAKRVQQDGFEVVQLQDTERDLRASIAPAIGNNVFELLCRGRDFLWRPHKSLTALNESKAFFGIPFLAPWANRLDQDAYWVNGAQYVINRKLGNIRDDANHKPIHGLLTNATWNVIEVAADEHGAHALAGFHFTQFPRMMAQFPFAHHLEMTHTLAGGKLHVRLRIVSECAEPIPVGIGFHPYCTLPGVPRDDWTVQLAARSHLELSAALIPTGRMDPVPGDGRVRLRGAQLDDGFTDLTRDQTGTAVFRAAAGNTSIAVGYGPHYPVAIVYSPKGSDFICFEPMAGLTDAFNLAHAGLYAGLQEIPPGGEWSEEFWLEPSLSA